MLNNLQVACIEETCIYTTSATLQLICWRPDGVVPLSGSCDGFGECIEDAGCKIADLADVHSASQRPVDPGEEGGLQGVSPRVANAAGEICGASVADVTTEPKVV